METFLKFIGILVLVFVTALLFNYPLMLLINYVFAQSFLVFVFGTAKLTFWKTYALSIALSLLFNRGK
jgi:hypothetical protein